MIIEILRRDFAKHFGVSVARHVNLGYGNRKREFVDCLVSINQLSSDR